MHSLRYSPFHLSKSMYWNKCISCLENTQLAFQSLLPVSIALLIVGYAVETGVTTIVALFQLTHPQLPPYVNTLIVLRRSVSYCNTSLSMGS